MNIRSYVIALFVMILAGSSAVAGNINWTDTGGGDFTDAGNWDDSVPGSGDQARFKVDGIYSATNTSDITNQKFQFDASLATVTLEIAVGQTWTLTDSVSEISTSSGTSNNVTINGGGTLNVNKFSMSANLTTPYSSLYVDNVTVTQNADGVVMSQNNGFSTFTITNASWSTVTNSGDFVIARGGWGGSGTGIVNVLSGGSIIVGRDLLLAYENGHASNICDGTLNVNGGIVYVNTHLKVGSKGTGLVSMTSGRIDVGGNTVVGNEAAGTGTLHITGGEYHSTNNWTTVGRNGKGTFIQSGGKSFWEAFTIAGDPGGTGRVEISGGELTVTNNAEMKVCGSTSAGTCLISGGTNRLSKVRIAQGAGWGRMEITGGDNYTGLQSEPLFVGSANNSTGILDITGGSLIVPAGSGWTRIASGNNSHGTLTTDGGYMEIPNQMRLCHGSGSTGVLNIVSGTNVFADNCNLGANSSTKATLNISGGLLKFTGGAMQVAENATAEGTVNVSGGLLSMGSAELRVASANNSTGVVNITGGVVDMGSAQLQIGRGNPSVATLNISGGTLTVTNDVRVGRSSNSTGNFNISGGTVYVMDTSGLEIAPGGTSVGTVSVIGTNATINVKWLACRSAGTPNLTYKMAEGGVSPIVVGPSETHLENDGTLTVRVNGYMETVTTNLIPLIDTTYFSAANSNFASTNASVFTVDYLGTTQLVAQLDNTRKASALAVQPNGYRWLTSTNAGWFGIDTNGLSGSTFDMYLRVDTNSATYTVSQLASAMIAEGQTAYATNKYGDDWLVVTLTIPKVDAPGFALDISGYDSGMEVDLAAINYLPNVYGSVFRLR